MGQYIQEGERLMFETVVKFAPKGQFLIPNDPDNVDGLNFLSGKPLSFVADQAMRGVILAHVDGGEMCIRDSSCSLPTRRRPPSSAPSSAAIA